MLSVTGQEEILIRIYRNLSAPKKTLALKLVETLRDDEEIEDLETGRRIIENLEQIQAGNYTVVTRETVKGCLHV